MKRALKISASAVVVLFAIVYIGASYFISSSLTEIDRKPLEDNPSNHGLQYENVEFYPPDVDVTLRGWLMLGNSLSKPLIFVHGHNSNREEYGDFLNIAAKLVGRGYSVLLFDLRGHGNSDGDRVSYGYFEQNDLRGAVDFLEGRGIAPNGVGVLGFSMGAGTAILGAAGEPRIRALVADSTYAKASDLFVSEIEGQTPVPSWIAPILVPGGQFLAKLLFDIDVGGLAPEKAVGRLPYPILVIHGELDSRVPVGHGIRVHSAAHPDSDIWIPSGIEHTDAYPTLPKEYIQKVTEYLDRMLIAE